MRLGDLIDFNPPTRLSKGSVAPFIDMSELPTRDRYISRIGIKEFSGSGSRFKDGDTLFARITPCLENGKGGFVTGLGNGVIGHGSTEFIVFRAKNPSDQNFTYYISRQPEFRRYAEKRMNGTSGRQRVSWKSLADFVIFVIIDISSDERVQIGQLLGALDDKIDLNRRMNETLEAMARALFKDWFVDFGPTRAKAEGRPPYLAPDIWNLFPDTIDEDNKPVGWEVHSLCGLVSLTKGRSYKSAELQQSNVALVTLKSFERGGGYREDGLKPYTGKYKPDQIITPGELVMALTDVTQAADVIGKPAIVLEDARYDTLVASLDVGIVRPLKDDIGTPFIACLMQTD